MIRRNCDNNAAVHLADRELISREPTKIENVGCRIEFDVGICSPRPNNIGRRHGVASLADQFQPPR
jgi:hypothetical protein